MISRHSLIQYFLFGFLLPIVLTGCLSFESSARDGLTVTVIDAYQGVKDGNAGDIPLPEESLYLTVEVCIENRSTVARSMQQEDVFLVTGNDTRLYPVALGYDQAEAFAWVLPYTEPIGGKGIVHRYYFFLVQHPELLHIPAHQSVGCSHSAQFKSLALLFLTPKHAPDQQYTLYFLEESAAVGAKKTSALSNAVKWGAGLGGFVIIIAVAAILVRKKMSLKQTSPLQEETEQPQ